MVSSEALESEDLDLQKGGSWTVGKTSVVYPGKWLPGGPAARQEALISEPRLEVPAMPSVAVVPPAERRLYIRKTDVEKYGATDGCPGCTCVLLDQPTVLPHTEACRTRLLELMSKDEQGRTRLEAHSRSRKRKSEVQASGPEKDVTVEEVTGDPGEVEAFPEIAEDPQERAAMGRAVAEEPQSARRAAKSKAKQTGEKKRPGQLTLAHGPPLAKPKPSPTKGEKRAAEATAEELRDEVAPVEPGVGTSSKTKLLGNSNQEMRACIETRKQCAKHNRPKHWRVRILRFSERRLVRHAKPAIRSWNRTSNSVVESDSNSAKGTVSRIGLGKARHIQTRYLWLQERVSMGRLKVVHVPGESNRADAFTKSVPGVQMKRTMEMSGYIYLGERSKGQMKLLDS